MAEGRNQPCPCGSRKKFKLCCGRSMPVGRHVDIKEFRRQQWITKLEKKYHTRDRALLAYLDQPEEPKGNNKADFIEEIVKHPDNEYSHKDHVGHPARRTRKQKRKSWFNPKTDDLEVRRWARRWREEYMNNVGKEGGVTWGLLRVAGEVVAEELSIGEDYVAIFSIWYAMICGELANRFDPDFPPEDLVMGLPSFFKWSNDNFSREDLAA